MKSGLKWNWCGLRKKKVTKKLNYTEWVNKHKYKPPMLQVDGGLSDLMKEYCDKEFDLIAEREKEKIPVRSENKCIDYDPPF